MSKPALKDHFGANSQSKRLFSFEVNEFLLSQSIFFVQSSDCSYHRVRKELTENCVKNLIRGQNLQGTLQMEYSPWVHELS